MHICYIRRHWSMSVYTISLVHKLNYAYRLLKPQGQRFSANVRSGSNVVYVHRPITHVPRHSSRNQPCRTTSCLPLPICGLWLYHVCYASSWNQVAVGHSTAKRTRVIQDCRTPRDGLGWFGFACRPTRLQIRKREFDLYAPRYRAHVKLCLQPPQNFRWGTMWHGTLNGGANAFVLGLYNVIWCVRLVNGNHEWLNLSSLRCFDGYSNANYALSEVRDPVRTIKRAAPLAVFAITSLYMLVNVAYYVVVDKEEILGSGRIAAALFFGKLWGLGTERVGAARES